ncbi:Carbohydrate sulfotransferase [Sergentomyia squamirostris]
MILLRNRQQCRIKKKFFLFLFVMVLILLVCLIQFSGNIKLNDHHNEAQYPVENLKQRSKVLTGIEMDKLEERMQKRVKHVAEICSKYRLYGTAQPNSREFLINKHHRLIWCNVFKAASTSWLYNFNILAGYTPQFLKKAKENPINLARKKYERPSIEQLLTSLNHAMAFIIVRHPFERLLSGYLDKIQNSDQSSIYGKLGMKIIQKYRKKKNLSSPRWPTFPEFVNYVLDEIHSNKSDEHWTPITNFCTPCQVHFDVIAKFETLNEDQMYIIEKANISHIISPEWKNPGKGTKNTVDLIYDFYNELSEEQVRELYEVYKHDFELFDYSVKEFLP